MFVKKYTWIWWKCWIINLSSNFLKSLLNFVNLLKFPNLLNIENFIIIRIKRKRQIGPQAYRLALMRGRPKFSACAENAGQANPTYILRAKWGSVLNGSGQSALPPLGKFSLSLSLSFSLSNYTICNLWLNIFQSWRKVLLVWSIEDRVLAG